MLGKKKTGLIVLGLSALSLGTIGFSSWIISGINGKATSDVTISVGEVKDQRIYMELNGESDTKLNFDADKDIPSGGVVSTGEDSKEDLEISFSFNIYSNSRDIFTTAMSGKKLYLNFSSTNENFKTAVNTNKYLLSPYAIDGADHVINEGKEDTNIDLTTPTEAAQHIDYTEKSGLKKLTYTVTKLEETSGSPQKYGSTVKLTYYFAWGAMFNYENPVKLTSDDFADAETALKAIGNLHNEQSLGLKIVASVK